MVRRSSVASSGAAAIAAACSSSLAYSFSVSATTVGSVRDRPARSTNAIGARLEMRRSRPAGRVIGLPVEADWRPVLEKVVAWGTQA